MEHERHHRRFLNVGAMLALAAASGLLFAQVLDTGFWSPEDYHELSTVMQQDSQGSLNQSPPVLGGGYPVNPVFAIEYRYFGMDSRSYYIVNLIVHVLNAWLAYALVNSLLHNRASAWMAALLFALGVGSYGKNLMFAGGISSLLYAMTVLSANLLYIWNEQRNAGKPFGAYAIVFFLIFLGSLFMRGGTFSILASCVFYNLFFRAERGRPVLHRTLVVCLVVAVVVWAWDVLRGQESIGGAVAPGAFLRNLPGYLILMAFPVQHSELLSSASGTVRAIYGLAPFIRVAVGLTFLSFSIFGIVFGNRAVRFYIAWIYVMVVPFAVFRYPADWLNLRFLYLVSLGFCVLLTTSAVYAARLLANRGWRRYVPYGVPALYVMLAIVLVTKLDAKNERLAARLDFQALRAQSPSLRTP
jgi:hypothetical protein